MNEKQPSIKLNMVMSVLLAASSVVFPLITLPYVSRVLGTDGVGRVYFAFSLVTFFSVFAELGAPVYGVRACARVRDDRLQLSRTVQEILIINLAACVIVYAVYALLIFTSPVFAKDRQLFMGMSLLILLNALGVEWLYKGLEKYTYITVRSVSFKAAALVLMFLLVKNSDDYIVYGCLTIFAASASNVLNLINAHRFISIRPVGGYNLRQHIPAMMMLFALAAATAIYTSLDTAILDFLRGDTHAGIYGVSVRIKLVLVSLVTAVAAVLLPRNSYYYGQGKHSEFYDLIRSTMSMILTVSVPVVCYFVVFAPECISILAGENFAGAVMPMRIITPSVVLIGVSNILGIQMLIPAGREFDTVKAALLGAVTDLILNFLLIPEYGAGGAAFATLIAEAFVMAYLMLAASRLRGKPGEGGEENYFFDKADFLKVSAAAAASAASVIWVRNAVTGDFARLAVSAACFFAVYAVAVYLINRVLKKN